MSFVSRVVFVFISFTRMPLRALAGAERSGFVRGTRAFAVAEARGTGGSVTRSRAMSAANVARDASAGSIPPAGVPSPLGKLDEQKTYSGRGGDLQDPPSGYFECNICLEVAQEPVVTQCGHLYCWPCIYKCVAPRDGDAPPRSPRWWLVKHIRPFVAPRVA